MNRNEMKQVRCNSTSHLYRSEKLKCTHDTSIIPETNKARDIVYSEGKKGKRQRDMQIVCGEYDESLVTDHFIFDSGLDLRGEWGMEAMINYT